jgi:hypothetical protein
LSTAQELVAGLELLLNVVEASFWFTIGRRSIPQ